MAGVISHVSRNLHKQSLISVVRERRVFGIFTFIEVQSYIVNYLKQATSRL